MMGLLVQAFLAGAIAGLAAGLTYMRIRDRNRRMAIAMNDGRYDEDGNFVWRSRP